MTILLHLFIDIPTRNYEYLSLNKALTVIRKYINESDFKEESIVIATFR